MVIAGAVPQLRTRRPSVLLARTEGSPLNKPDIESIVRTLLAGGESYYVEFKSAWSYGSEGKQPRDIKEVARDIGNALVAFANSEGGDLLVGVEDTGAITGIPWEGDALGYLEQAARHQVREIDLGARVHNVVIDGQRVLLFRVQEYPAEAVVTADGRCLARQGPSSAPMRPQQISARRQDRLGELLYESQPVPGANLSDLNLDDLQHGVGVPPQSHLLDLLHRSPETLLRYWNLVEQRNGSVVLKRAALLLFAREPLRWHPNNRIRLRRVHGSDAGYGRTLRTRDHELAGPLPTILSLTSTFLRHSLDREAQQDLLFAISQLLPWEAVQECLVNAVAHRNYAIDGQAIEILLYPDRVEFRSPGTLPAPITIEDLMLQKGVHRSRNPLIMRVLRDLGWARDQGEGMRRIFGSMRQMELHEPELAVEADTFVVRLSTRSLYDDSTQAWIASYGPFGLLPEERRYMVALRQAGGRLSIDKLARRVGESYDETKRALLRLERKHLVWHVRQSRTYRLVEPLNVPHERALVALVAAGIDVDGKRTADVVIDMETLQRLAKTEDPRAALDLATRWKETGILAPAGKKQWKLGPSFVEYVARRSNAARVP
jgi:ATP-dependent DNA helicase RecG